MKTSSILTATTDAANSDGFSVDIKNPTTVACVDLAGVETATLQISTDKGATWDDTSYTDGTTIQCTSTVVTFLICGPGEYRIAKSATAGAAGVSIAQ